MSEHQFYAKKSRGNERQIILRSATLLVNKAKEKRIKMNVSMPLSGRKMGGTPEWITNALTYVSQNHDTVSAEVEFSGLDLHFSDENLFNGTGTKAPRCQLKKFIVLETGTSETPDVDLQFVIYAPFSSALLKWVGQYAGEEFWAKFEQVEQPAEDLELTGDDDQDEEEEEAEES